jgi:hypothetical protein
MASTVLRYMLPRTSPNQAKLTRNTHSACHINCSRAIAGICDQAIRGDVSPFMKNLLASNLCWNYIESYILMGHVTSLKGSYHGSVVE